MIYFGFFVVVVVVFFLFFKTTQCTFNTASQNGSHRAELSLHLK